MARITREVPGIHMANMVEGGKTPIPSMEKLDELGFPPRHFPFDAALGGDAGDGQDCLADMKADRHPEASPDRL